MSHDIRTPINGIRDMIEVAEYYKDNPEKQEECRKKIWETSGFLMELVNEVLDMGKLESGEVELEKREFNLQEVLDKIIEVVKKQADEIPEQCDGEEPVQPKSINGIKILVVEDNELNMEIAEFILESVGYRRIRSNKNHPQVRQGRCEKCHYYRHDRECIYGRPQTGI